MCESSEEQDHVKGVADFPHHTVHSWVVIHTNEDGAYGYDLSVISEINAAMDDER